MQLILTTTSQFYKASDIKENEDIFFTPRFIPNCYGRNNILVADIDNGRICIQFDIAFDENCEQLPTGIYIDIVLSNYPDQVIRGQFKNFDYSSDQYLCYSCPVIGTDTTCLFIQNTDAAQVQIKSLTRYTTLPVGKISIEHSTMSGCYVAASSQMFWGESEAKLQLYQTGLCPYFGVDYHLYSFVLTKLDGEVDSIDISYMDEEGNTIVTESAKDGYVEMDITYDFSKYYLNSYTDVKVILTMNISNIIVIQTTQVSLLQSYDLALMYQNAVFTVWAKRLSLTADPLANAQELQDKYAVNAVRVQQRYEIFDKTTGETLANLLVDVLSFDFLNIVSNVLCNDLLDGGTCSDLLVLLQNYNLSQVELLFHYYFYDSNNNIILYSSNLVTQVENTCWSGVYTTYYENKVCATFSSNEDSLFCKFINPTEIIFRIDFDSYSMSTKINYSIQVDDVCVECQDEHCKQQISKMYRQKSSVSFTFKTGQDDYSLFSINNYSENYSQLHQRIFIIAIIILILLVVLIILRILRIKGIIGSNKKLKQKDVVNEDEI